MRYTVIHYEEREDRRLLQIHEVAALRCTPSWLERLLGQKERLMYVVKYRGYWIDDHGADVPSGVDRCLSHYATLRSRREFVVSLKLPPLHTLEPHSEPGTLALAENAGGTLALTGGNSA